MGAIRAACCRTCREGRQFVALIFEERTIGPTPFTVTGTTQHRGRKDHLAMICFANCGVLSVCYQSTMAIGGELPAASPYALVLLPSETMLEP